jgi:hypothetical protein
MIYFLSLDLKTNCTHSPSSSHSSSFVPFCSSLFMCDFVSLSHSLSLSLSCTDGFAEIHHYKSSSPSVKLLTFASSLRNIMLILVQFS